MFNTKETWEIINKYKEVLQRIPDKAHFDVDGLGGKKINFQAASQAAVKAIRSQFPGAIWKKEWDAGLKWWEYHTTLKDGVLLHIYACYENPATCKAIYEEIPVMRTITPEVSAVEEPTGEVVMKIVGWDCGEGEKNASQS